MEAVENSRVELLKSTIRNRIYRTAATFVLDGDDSVLPPVGDYLSRVPPLTEAEKKVFLQADAIMKRRRRMVEEARREAIIEWIRKTGG